MSAEKGLIDSSQDATSTHNSSSMVASEQVDPAASAIANIANVTEHLIALSSLDSWMTSRPYLAKCPINQLAIPGSHDAGMLACWALGGAASLRLSPLLFGCLLAGTSSIGHFAKLSGFMGEYASNGSFSSGWGAREYGAQLFAPVAGRCLLRRVAQPEASTTHVFPAISSFCTLPGTHNCRAIKGRRALL